MKPEISLMLATKEALRYRTALNQGLRTMQKRL